MTWNKEELLDFLKKPKKIIITSHQSPDGDALGSSLALWHVLKAENHDVQVILPDAFPKFLAWMPGSEQIVITDNDFENAKNLCNSADLICCLDYNALKRIGDLGAFIAALATPKIMIDHHQQPEDFPVMLRWDVNETSTAQLIYDFILEMGWEKHLNSKVASCIYTGIMTDTGSFRFPLTSSKTHFTVAKLLETGIKPAEIYNLVSDSNTYNKLQLMGYALSKKMVFKKDLNTVYIVLTEEELKSFDYQKGDTEGLVNYGLSISGVKLAIFIAEFEGVIKMSFRSKGSFDVNEFARKRFNGGGHKNAAGGRMYLDLTEAIAALEEELINHKDLLLKDA